MAQLSTKRSLDGSRVVLFASAGALGMFALVFGAASCGSDTEADSSSGGSTGGSGAASSGGAGGGAGAAGGAGTAGGATGGSGTGLAGNGGSGVCGACLADEVCDPTLGCVDCTADAGCPDPQNSVCVVGKCEACGTAADCNNNQVCHPTQNECGDACAGNGDCDQGNADICDLPGGLCVECLDAGDCQNEPFCDPVGNCVDCLADADCGAAAPYCDGGGSCEQCLFDNQCGAGDICVDQECEPSCSSDDDCGDKLCDMGTGICVECLGNGDCPDNQDPICADNQKCEECNVDGDCNGEACIDFQCGG